VLPEGFPGNEVAAEFLALPVEEQTADTNGAEDSGAETSDTTESSDD
jgi:hypothetical protein